MTDITIQITIVDNGYLVIAPGWYRVVERPTEPDPDPDGTLIKKDVYQRHEDLIELVQQIIEDAEDPPKRKAPPA